MIWDKLFDKEHEPQDNQIKEFVDTPLWDDLTGYLQRTYNVKPKLFYSSCAMDDGFWKGWNVKYKKGGKALCTLYPKQGYFVALMPIGLREMDEAESLIPSCTAYMQNLFKQTRSGHNGKSLAIEVKNPEIIDDMKKLVALRISP